MSGFEHYDAVTNRDCNISSDSEKELSSEDMPTNNKTADITIDDKNISGNDNEQTPTKVRQQPNDCTESEIITPRKQAKFKSPKRKCLTRKRRSKPETWTRNIRKQKRQSGESYMSVSGKFIDARKLSSHSCFKCRFKCGKTMSEEERLNIFTTYWNLQSYERQRDYICSQEILRGHQAKNENKLQGH